MFSFQSDLSFQSFNTVFFRASFLNKGQLMNFIHRILVLYLKTHCQTQDHLDFILFIFPRRSIVLHFAFSSMIHFQLIFVKGIRSMSKFTFLPMDFQLYQYQVNVIFKSDYKLTLRLKGKCFYFILFCTKLLERNS